MLSVSQSEASKNKQPDETEEEYLRRIDEYIGLLKTHDQKRVFFDKKYV